MTSSHARGALHVQQHHGLRCRRRCRRPAVLAPHLPGGLAYAIDLRKDRADFAGDKVAAYRAAQTRSFLESSLEHQFLQKFTGLPSDATFTVFGMMKDDVPDDFGRRFAQIRTTLESMSSGEARFSVSPDGRPKGAPIPSVRASFAPDGIHVAGGPILREVADKLAADPSGDAVKLPAGGSGVFADVDHAAAAVETALLAADVQPPVMTDYPMITEIRRGPVSLVQPGARSTSSGAKARVERTRTSRSSAAASATCRTTGACRPA